MIPLKHQPFDQDLARMGCAPLGLVVGPILPAEHTSAKSAIVEFRVNMDQAARMSELLWLRQVPHVCLQTLFGPFLHLAPPAFMLRPALSLVYRSSFVVALPGWQRCEYCRIAVRLAEQMKLPVFEWPPLEDGDDIGTINLREMHAADLVCRHYMEMANRADEVHRQMAGAVEDARQVGRPAPPRPGPQITASPPLSTATRPTDFDAVRPDHHPDKHAGPVDRNRTRAYAGEPNYVRDGSHDPGREHC